LKSLNRDLCISFTANTTDSTMEATQVFRVKLGGV
jgi:hypothetical protein